MVAHILQEKEEHMLTILVHRLISGSQPEGPMALLPIFCVARSSRTDLSMIVARALKIGKIPDGGMPPTYETMH